MAVAIIALVIAAFSLLVAAGSLKVSRRADAREQSRDTRSVNVMCLPGYNTDPPPGVPLRIITVRAVNEGHRPIEIRAVQFQTADGGFFWPPKVAGDEVSKVLGDGQSINVHFDRDAIEQVAAEQGVTLAHAAVYDAAGNGYTTPYPSDGE